MEIKGVLLDLDHTLYDYKLCDGAGMKVVLKRLTREYEKSEKEILSKFAEARRSVKIDLSGSGSAHSRILYFKKLVESLGGRTDAALILELEAAYTNEYFRHMTLYEHVREFLGFCKKKGAKVAIVTDMTTGIQLRKLVALKINEYVDYVITSEEAGKEKPSPYIYYIALNRIGCKPSEAIMVGDDCVRDIEGAMNLGIRAYNICEESSWKDYEKWMKGRGGACCLPK